MHFIHLINDVQVRTQPTMANPITSHIDTSLQINPSKKENIKQTPTRELRVTKCAGEEH